MADQSEGKPAEPEPAPPPRDPVERFLISEAKGVGFCLLQAVLLVVFYLLSLILIARFVPGAAEEFSFNAVRRAVLPSPCLWSCATSVVGAIVGSRVIVALIRRARQRAGPQPPD